MPRRPRDERLEALLNAYDACTDPATWLQIERAIEQTLREEEDAEEDSDPSIFESDGPYEETRR
jgi:hypothetical protein